MKRLDYKWQDCETWRGLGRELSWGALFAAILMAIGLILKRAGIL